MQTYASLDDLLSQLPEHVKADIDETEAREIWKDKEQREEFLWWVEQVREAPEPTAPEVFIYKPEPLGDKINKKLGEFGQYATTMIGSYLAMLYPVVGMEEGIHAGTAAALGGKVESVYVGLDGGKVLAESISNTGYIVTGIMPNFLLPLAGFYILRGKAWQPAKFGAGLMLILAGATEFVPVKNTDSYLVTAHILGDAVGHEKLLAVKTLLTAGILGSAYLMSRADILYRKIHDFVKNSFKNQESQE